MKSQILKTVTGADELPIEDLQGYKASDEKIHQEILKRYEKAVKRDIATSAFWLVMSIVFVIVQAIMYMNTHNNRFLIFIIIFAVTDISCIYRLKKYDYDVIKCIRAKMYQVRQVKIGRMMPRVTSLSGKPAAKIMDEDNKIYNREFAMNRKNQKIYKKNPETEFTLIHIDKSNIYSLTYINEQVE